MCIYSEKVLRSPLPLSSLGLSRPILEEAENPRVRAASVLPSLFLRLLPRLSGRVRVAQVTLTVKMKGKYSYSRWDAQSRFGVHRMETERFLPHSVSLPKAFLQAHWFHCIVAMHVHRIVLVPFGTFAQHRIGVFPFILPRYSTPPPFAGEGDEPDWRDRAQGKR